MAPFCARLGAFDLLKNLRMTRALVSAAFLVRPGVARARFSSQHGSFWRLERLIFAPLAPSVRSLQNIGRSYDFSTSELARDTTKSIENRRNARLHSDERPGRPTWTPKAASWLPRRPTCRPRWPSWRPRWRSGRSWGRPDRAPKRPQNDPWRPKATKIDLWLRFWSPGAPSASFSACVLDGFGDLRCSLEVVWRFCAATMYASLHQRCTQGRLVVWRHLRCNHVRAPAPALHQSKCP